jgi:hypothetical protein
MAKAKEKPDTPFTDLWHIASMGTWDENYFNEAAQGRGRAVQIRKNCGFPIEARAARRHEGHPPGR